MQQLIYQLSIIFFLSLSSCSNATTEDTQSDAVEPATAETGLEASQSMAMGEDERLEEELRQIETFLKEKDMDYQKSPDNLIYTVERKGDGAKPASGDYVKVHYSGRLLDGKTFDSSYDRGEPIVFQLGTGRVIQGWDLGIQLFKVGSKGTLYIPSSLGYGERAMADIIPANSILVFDIEVLDIMNEEEANAFQQQQAEERRKKQEEAAKEQMVIDQGIIENYIKENNIEAMSTASGLHYIVEEQGSGAKAEAGKMVKVHYKGMLLDGTVFDSSFDRGEPIEFPLGAGRVIPGWDEGIALFNEGGKGRLIIPSVLAYGPRAAGQIPPNSVLIFDIEVVSVGE